MYLLTSERQGSNPRPPERTRALSQLSYVPLCASCSSAGVVNLSEVLRYAQFIWVRPSEIICRAVTPGKQGFLQNERKPSVYLRLHHILYYLQNEKCEKNEIVETTYATFMKFTYSIRTLSAVARLPILIAT